MLITTQQKDQVLQKICGFADYDCGFYLDYKEFPDINETSVNGIMRYFERIGFIRNFTYVKHMRVQFALNYEATDFLLKGGFHAQEEILNANMERLSLEIDRLTPKLGEDAINLLNICANLCSVISVLYPIK